jgi:ADP-ribosylglycohydrolase
MLGAIAGDIIGSPYEARNLKSTEFPLFGPDCEFTDDSVLTVAVADVLLNGGSYVDAYHDYFHRCIPAKEGVERSEVSGPSAAALAR